MCRIQSRNLKNNEGFNAATDEYGDLVKAGVIDPVKVTRSALANAASIAAMFLTTEALVFEKPEEPKDAQPDMDIAMDQVVIHTNK